MFIIIIMVHLRMQPEGYGAAIYTFELQSLIASSSPQFLFLRCCEVLLFCRLVSVLLPPSDGCFLVSSGLRGKASCAIGVCGAGESGGNGDRNDERKGRRPSCV